MRYQCNHKNHQFGKKEHHFSFDGEDLGTHMMSTATIDVHWKHMRRDDERKGGVTQELMREHAKEYQWHFNSRFENKVEKMFSYFDTPLTANICAEFRAWERGEPFFKRRKQSRRKGQIFADEWQCGRCNRVVRDTPASRWQHRQHCKGYLLAHNVSVEVDSSSRKKKMKPKAKEKYQCECCLKAGKDKFMWANKSQHIKRHRMKEIKGIDGTPILFDFFF